MNLNYNFNIKRLKIHLLHIKQKTNEKPTCVAQRRLLLRGGLCIHRLCRHDIPFGAGRTLWHSYSQFFRVLPLRNSTMCRSRRASGGFRIRSMTECWKTRNYMTVKFSFAFPFAWQKFSHNELFILFFSFGLLVAINSENCLPKTHRAGSR